VKKLVFLFIFFLFIMVAVAGCGGSEELSDKNEKVILSVSAAMSLKDVAEELKAVYTGQHAGVDIVYNFAASGTLQKQIEEGAPVDLFISAGEPSMDALAEKDLIIDGSRRDLLENEMVLIAGEASSLTGFQDLADQGVSKISIGMPEAVPAGKYARDVLTALKLWDKVANKLVLAKDVRQVLTYVESGNVDAGIVYRTDALAGKNIKIVAPAPDGSHEPVIYPMAIIKTTRHQKEAEELADFFTSDEAARVFVKYNFKPVRK